MPGRVNIEHLLDQSQAQYPEEECIGIISRKLSPATAEHESMNHYWPGPLPEPSVRTLDDMRCVLANPDQSGNIPLYYMYRDLALTAGDRAYLREQNVRFDITVIPPGTVGGEYVKTKGHYHPLSPSGIGYPELYQVLAGEALYHLQRSS